MHWKKNSASPLDSAWKAALASLAMGMGFLYAAYRNEASLDVKNLERFNIDE